MTAVFLQQGQTSDILYLFDICELLLLVQSIGSQPWGADSQIEIPVRPAFGRPLPILRIGKPFLAKARSSSISQRELSVPHTHTAPVYNPSPLLGYMVQNT